jgi:nicotinamide-nucleotide amidase
MSVEIYARILVELEKRELKLAIAESLTGGLVASNFISIAGASKVVLGSVVAYQDSLKREMLGVAQNLLDARGAVSAEVASAMATGVRERLAHAADISLDRVIGISTTGVAGPEPEGSIAAGTVFVAVQGTGGEAILGSYSFEGDRTIVREAAAHAVAQQLWDYLAR